MNSISYFSRLCRPVFSPLLKPINTISRMVSSSKQKSLIHNVEDIRRFGKIVCADLDTLCVSDEAKTGRVKKLMLARNNDNLQPEIFTGTLITKNHPDELVQKIKDYDIANRQDNVGVYLNIQCKSHPYLKCFCITETFNLTDIVSQYENPMGWLISCNENLTPRAKPGFIHFENLYIDTKNEDLLCKIENVIYKYMEESILCIVEERRGFHFVIDAHKTRKNHIKSVYELMKSPEMSYEYINLYGEKVKRHRFYFNHSMRIPVPGCIQGDFYSRMWDHSEWLAKRITDKQ